MASVEERYLLQLRALADEMRAAIEAALSAAARAEHRPSADALTDFLLARIDEDEAATVLGRCMCKDGEAKRPDCADRVLAECAAKRRLVEWARPETWPCKGFFGVISGPAQIVTRAGEPTVLHMLASVYADHPDYRPEWRA